MDTNSQFVTKKDLYSVAVNVCWLIFLTGLLSDEERTNDGDSRIPVQVQVRERRQVADTKR